MGAVLTRRVLHGKAFGSERMQNGMHLTLGQRSAAHGFGAWCGLQGRQRVLVKGIGVHLGMQQLLAEQGHR